MIGVETASCLGSSLSWRLSSNFLSWVLMTVTTLRRVRQREVLVVPEHVVEDLDVEVRFRTYLRPPLDLFRTTGQGASGSYPPSGNLFKRPLFSCLNCGLGLAVQLTERDGTDALGRFVPLVFS